MIQGLWDWQTDTTIDVKIDDDDADYYRFEPMAELLDQWKKIKKYKHGMHCHY